MKTIRLIIIGFIILGAVYMLTRSCHKTVDTTARIADSIVDFCKPKIFNHHESNDLIDKKVFQLLFSTRKFEHKISQKKSYLHTLEKSIDSSAFYEFGIGIDLSKQPLSFNLDEKDQVIDVFFPVPQLLFLGKTSPTTYSNHDGTLGIKWNFTPEETQEIEQEMFKSARRHVEKEVTEITPAIETQIREELSNRFPNHKLRLHFGNASGLHAVTT